MITPSISSKPDIQTSPNPYIKSHSDDIHTSPHTHPRSHSVIRKSPNPYEKPQRKLSAESSAMGCIQDDKMKRKDIKERERREDVIKSVPYKNSQVSFHRTVQADSTGLLENISFIVIVTLTLTA
ncbi:hypothetical protein M231_02467 [Tremella mesenterica]|uniref:Uncharacterized protein n=1 Tax=Tremella mesenterica TaxID=5217 RepID=A0A4Q1BQI9_TREME|nr:hypothetical protein M231_02467 [Tremella mesenterica]